jgi:hypothetical protein
MPLRPLSLLLVAAAAAAPNGCRAPRAHIEVVRLVATRPQLVLVRCRTTGFASPPKFSWTLGPGVRTTGYGERTDEDALMVQLLSPKGALTVQCNASVDGASASAEVGLGPIAINKAKLAGTALTIEGGGFSTHRGPDDAVWLVPARGDALRADSACKGAVGGDARIVACVPAPLKSAYQVRVQSGGRLGLGPVVGK